MNRATGIFFALLASLALLSAAGCKTRSVVEVKQPLSERTWIVTRVGDTATLRWESDSRMLYTVFYASRRDARARWLPLAACVNVPGTGETMIVTDEVPLGQQRYYRLHVQPIRPTR